MTKEKTLLFLVAITIVSVIIRFNQLGSIPNGLATDEADIGYNAYSIAKTGADVYGRKFPLFFQSLDDYKPGLIVYLSIPAILLFGLNDFSIRLAPAIIGSITPILVYILLKLLYSQKSSAYSQKSSAYSQKSSAYPKDHKIAYIGSFFTVFAPWNIALSRAMVQYIPLAFFYLVFIIIFLFSVKKFKKLLPLSALIIGITPYIYYAAFIYLPFILLILGIVYRKFLITNFRYTIMSLLIVAIISMPAVFHFRDPIARSRLSAINATNPDIALPISIQEMEQDKEEGNPLSKVIHNRRLVFTNILLDNYFDYFNFDYLFVNSHAIRYFYVHNVGLFYLVELPLVLLGIFKSIVNRRKSDMLVLGLLIIGPIPATITLGSPLPHRALLVPLVLQLLSAKGASSILNLLHKNTRRVIVPLFIIIYAAGLYFFLHQYFVHSPREFVLGGWFPVVRDAIPVVNRQMENYDKVVFTWSVQRIVPPIYFLFYNQIDPKIIQEKAAKWGNEPVSYRQIYNKIENLEFRPINWDADKNLKNTLLVGYPNEFPEEVNVIARTYLPNGKPHFLLVEAGK